MFKRSYMTHYMTSLTAFLKVFEACCGRPSAAGCSPSSGATQRLRRPDWGAQEAQEATKPPCDTKRNPKRNKLQ